jgi:hypothetical protein
MAIFKYTLPSGNEFELITPNGYTQTQADFVFYSQVAAGSLVGYTIGQILTSAQTRLTKFELSRLERDTAGVDNATILSIVSGDGSVSVGGTTGTILSVVTNNISLSVPSLLNVPLQTPITPADYAGTEVGLGLDPVGPFTPEEVQALITTTEVFVDQQTDTITDTGIGTYNLTPESLEKTGYLKPGTSNYPDFACVVGTPSVWTGKDGVTSVAGILDDPALQTKIQNGVLQLNYAALTASGTIQTQNSAPASTSTGQIYGAIGLTALTAASLVSGTAALSGNFNKLITSSFAGATSLASSISGQIPASVSSLLSTPINNISTIASGAVNSATQGVSNLTAGATAAANQLVKESVGAVVNNAAQFTAPVAAAWAQGSALLNSTLGSAQGVLNSVAGQAQGLLTGAIGSAQGYATNALGSLSGLATGALGSLGTQAQSLLGNLGSSLDIFGKMSSFSVDFSLFSSDSLVSATKVAAGFSNTVNRQTVDAAVTRILDNPKISTPSFEFPSALTAGINADILQAQNKLSELKKQYIG